MLVRSKTMKVYTPLLRDDEKKTFSLFRKLLIFAKLFVEAVVIFVAIFLNYKSLYPNIDTKQNKFKKKNKLFIVKKASQDLLAIGHAGNLLTFSHSIIFPSANITKNVQCAKHLFQL